MTLIVEVALALLSIIVSVCGFYIKRLYKTVDGNTMHIKSVEKELTNHRVDDAAKFVSRQEMDVRFHHLRDDIRGMISPLREELQNIENFLRQQKK